MENIVFIRKIRTFTWNTRFSIVKNIIFLRKSSFTEEIIHLLLQKQTFYAETIILNNKPCFIVENTVFISKVV